MAAAFAEQSRHCAALGSPFMARLMALFADRLAPGTPLADRLFAWPGNPAPSADSLPLRMAGALHALRLNGHAGLCAVYPPVVASDDELWGAVLDAMRQDAPFIHAFIDSPPQTNDVRRSAVLIGTGLWLTAATGLPLVLSELGASAGLNLTFERFQLALGGMAFGASSPALRLAPEWHGPLPPAGALRVLERAGSDLAPLDPHDAGDCLRLCAYLWPDQPERLALTRAAIAVSGPAPVRCDAADWLAGRLTPRPGSCHLVYSTVAWQYFTDDTKARCHEALQAAGAQATADAPLACFAMEADGADPGAGLSLRLWPGDHLIPFGRADFHGRWVDWTAPPPFPPGASA